MKKILTTVIACTLAATAAFAQVNIGAGYTGITHHPSEGDNSWNNGFYLQVGYNLPLGLGFEFAPALQYNYSTRSEDATIGIGNASASVTNRFNEHYLNLPLMFNYGYEICPGARIFVFAGPTVSFGLYGDCKVTADASVGNIAASTEKETIKLWGEDSDYGRWDVKIGGGLGIDIAKHYRIQVGYDYGLVNRFNKDGFKLHHHGLTAGFSYLF